MESITADIAVLIAVLGAAVVGAAVVGWLSHSAFAHAEPADGTLPSASTGADSSIRDPR